jgi:hypothetical protein
MWPGRWTRSSGRTSLAPLVLDRPIPAAPPSRSTSRRPSERFGPARGEDPVSESRPDHTNTPPALGHTSEVGRSRALTRLARRTHGGHRHHGSHLGARTNWPRRRPRPARAPRNQARVCVARASLAPRTSSEHLKPRSGHARFPRDGESRSSSSVATAGRPERERIRPLARNISYPHASARQVVRHWRLAGRSSA